MAGGHPGGPVPTSPLHVTALIAFRIVVRPPRVITSPGGDIAPVTKDRDSHSHPGAGVVGVTAGAFPPSPGPDHGVADVAFGVVGCIPGAAEGGAYMHVLVVDRNVVVGVTLTERGVVLGQFDVLAVNPFDVDVPVRNVGTFAR